MSATAELDLESQLAELFTPPEAAQSRYLETVCGIVAGEKFTPATVREVLADANRTPADLASHCRRLRQRRESIEALAANPNDSAPDFSLRLKVLDDEAKAAEEAHRQVMAGIERRRHQIAQQQHAAQSAAMQTRSGHERIIHATTSPAILAELQRLRDQLGEVQKHRLRLEGDAWRHGDEAAIRSRLAAERERLDALTEARGDRADGAGMVRGLIGKLSESLGAITSTKREAAELLTQEQTLVARHNELGARLYDWREFTIATNEQ